MPGAALKRDFVACRDSLAIDESEHFRGHGTRSSSACHAPCAPLVKHAAGACAGSVVPPVLSMSFPGDFAMLGPLPLNALVAFEAASRHLSFARAATELNVTPAAISQQIRSLEDQLGTRLFHRRSRGLALTAAAEAGLPSLREGIERLSFGVERMRGESERNVLNIWAAPSFASKWLVPRLQRFAESHPDITLNITASGDLMDTSGKVSTLPASAFRDDDIDIAIRFGKGQYPGCRVEKLMSAAVVPLCSPALLKKHERPLRRPADLAFHTLLHDDTPYDGRPDWKSWLAAAGVDSIDAARGIHFNHVSLALEAAVDSQGVVLSIGQLASNDLAAGRLVIPFETRVPLEYAYHLISLDDAPDAVRPRALPPNSPRPNAANVDAFRDWVKAEAAGQDDELLDRVATRIG